MRVSIWAFAASAALFVGAAGAQAATVYDSDVGSPGWLNGSGNPNGGFTVSTDNDIEIGLRAKYRQNPNVIHSSDNSYTVVAGPQTAATSGGPIAPTKAAWNYEFSINTASANLTISDIIALLTITDPNGHSATVDPLTYWSDNTGYNGAKQQPMLSDSTLAQNSQNAAFGDFPLASYYSMWTTGLYTFTLDIKDLSNNLLASDSINVNVVPVPLPNAAWGGLAMMGVLGGVVVRKRLRNAGA